MQSAEAVAAKRKVLVDALTMCLERSKVKEGLEWEVPQLVSFLDPDSARFNAKAARAMGMRKDGSWAWAKRTDGGGTSAAGMTGAMRQIRHIRPDAGQRPALHYRRYSPPLEVDSTLKILRTDAFR